MKAGRRLAMRAAAASRRAAALTLAGLVAGTGALAAPGGDPIEVKVPQGALACLQENETGPMTYPARAAEQKIGGTVRVRLTFSAADSAPKADVFFDSLGGEFRDEVLSRVSRYRLPCFKPSERAVVATQEFQFVPGDGRKVMWSGVRRDTDRSADIGCLTGAEQVPAYPHRWDPHGLITRATSGTVLAEFTFKDGHSAPDRKILFDGGSPRFASVVQDYIGGYRLPCLKAGDPPLRLTQTFRFSLSYEPPPRLPDMPLVRFLTIVEGIEEQKVRFDFTTMSCPFDLKFVLFQPLAENSVGEVERSDANRREFIEWLKSIRLNLKHRTMTHLLGDSMTIAVPCAIVDLT